MNNIKDFEDLLSEKYGEEGSPKREEYDNESLTFRLGVMLKEARKEANLTQDELAQKTGTKKSYISKIENGESTIELATFSKLIQIGLNKRLNISIS